MRRLLLLTLCVIFGCNPIFSYNDIQLNAPGGGTSYQWHYSDGSGISAISGANNASLTLNQPGVYFATYQRGLATEASDFFIATCQDCEDTLVSLNLDSCIANYQWYERVGASSHALTGENDHSMTLTASAAPQTFFAEITASASVTLSSGFTVMRMSGTEDCGNGIDDDGDGLIDCADIDCISHHTCCDVATCNNCNTSTAHGGDDANTVLLMHFDNFNDSVNFIPEGLGGSSSGITVSGSAHASRDMTQIGCGALDLTNGGSLELTGPGSVSDFDFSPQGDFTIEAWVYPTAPLTNGESIVGNFYSGTGNSFVFQLNTSDGSQVCGITTSTSGGTGGFNNKPDVSAGLIPVNQWTHVAVVRDSHDLRFYYDGVQLPYGSGTPGSGFPAQNTFNLNLVAPTNPLAIGRGINGASNNNFYMDELRISNVARYGVGNFTPESVNGYGNQTSCDTAVVSFGTCPEICNNSIDDDGDGLIDEYCFPEPITTFCGTSLEGVFNNGSPFAIVELPGNGRALLNQHTFGGVSEISIMTIDSNLNSVNSTMISSPTSNVIGFRPVGAIYVPNHGICVYGENEGNSTSDTRMGLAMIDETTLTAQWSSYVSPGPGWTYGSTHQFGEAIYDPISGNIIIVGQTGGAHATFVSGTFTIYSAIDPSNGTVIENEAYIVPNNNNPQGMNSSSQSIFHSGSHVALGGYGGAGKGPIFSIIDTATNEKIVNNHYPFPHTAGQFVSIRDLTEINGSYYGTLLNTWDGASTDAGIIKIAPNGDLVWAYMTDTTTESTYDIFGGIYPIEDQASFFVLGTSNGSWTSGGQDLVVMRVDTNGTVLWQKGVGGTGYDAMANGNNAVSVKGGLEIYAWVPTPISGRNFKVIHIDTAGNVSTDNCHDIPGTYSMIDVSPVTGTVAFSDTSLPQTFTSITISDSAIVNDTFICGCCPTIADNVVTPPDTACATFTVVVDGSTPTLNFGTPSYQWFRSLGASGPWTVIAGATNEDLTVIADTSGFYYKRHVFVPDCPGDTSASVPLWVEACPEICNNGIDDDGDGLTDCLDPDCAAEVSCDLTSLCSPSNGGQFATYISTQGALRNPTETTSGKIHVPQGSHYGILNAHMLGQTGSGGDDDNNEYLEIYLDFVTNTYTGVYFNAFFECDPQTATFYCTEVPFGSAMNSGAITGDFNTTAGQINYPTIHFDGDSVWIENSAGATTINNSYASIYHIDFYSYFESRDLIGTAATSRTNGTDSISIIIPAGTEEIVMLSSGLPQSTSNKLVGGYNANGGTTEHHFRKSFVMDLVNNTVSGHNSQTAGPRELDCYGYGFNNKPLGSAITSDYGDISADELDMPTIVMQDSILTIYHSGQHSNYFHEGYYFEFYSTNSQGASYVMSTQPHFINNGQKFNFTVVDSHAVFAKHVMYSGLVYTTCGATDENQAYMYSVLDFQNGNSSGVTWGGASTIDHFNNAAGMGIWAEEPFGTQVTYDASFGHVVPIHEVPIRPQYDYNSATGELTFHQRSEMRHIAAVSQGIFGDFVGMYYFFTILQDAAVTVDSVTSSSSDVHFTICNNGGQQIPAGLDYTVYSGDPFEAGASVILTSSTSTAIDTGSCLTVMETFAATGGTITVIVGDDGTTALPLTLGSLANMPTALNECDYTNSFASFTPVEDCDNGIDDDGDGLIDCSDPDCATYIACFSCNAVGIDSSTGDTTWQVITPESGYNRAIAYRYSGDDQRFTVPSGTSTLNVKAWGAGGGQNSSVSSRVGGAGGYANGEIPTTGGEVYSIIVGQGGWGSHTVNGQTQQGNHGFGGIDYTSFTAHRDGNGGGFSGIFTGSTEITNTDTSRAIIIAGGGGGGTDSEGGFPGNSSTNGGGSSLYMLGEADPGDGIFAGNGGGAGGGGFIGGSTNVQGGGNGGSGTLSSTVVNGGMQSSAFGTVAPPNTTDVHYISGAGRGGVWLGGAFGPLNAGQNGLVIVQWNDTAGAIVEIAGDLIDNDCDGLIDCADPDLALDPSCYACNALGIDSATGDTTWQVVQPGNGYNRAVVYRFTGSDQGFEVPAGVDSFHVKAWGAAGGWDGGGTGNVSGPGGFSEGVISATAGESFSLVIGEGGWGTGMTTAQGGIYGFGGEDYPVHIAQRDANGGGLSGIFSDINTVLSTDTARALIIAGGGAGTTNTVGQHGGPGNSLTHAGGGSLYMQGEVISGSIHSGGGGGGYQGGDVVTSTRNFGGTGFIDNSVSSGSLVATAFGSADAPNSTDVHYMAGVAAGKSQGSGSGADYNGGHGMMVIQWNDPAGPIAEIPGDLIDNDCDGFVDCNDPDLATDPSCTLCANSVGIDSTSGDTAWHVVAPSAGYNRAIAIRHTGFNQSFVVPAGVDTLSIKAWGAGGAGASQFVSGRNPEGGGGGFVQGNLSVTGGEAYTLVVGEGGKIYSPNRTYGGGGAGGRGQSGAHGPSGGGRSAIQFAGSELATAGAGGGASFNDNNDGGAGGGATAQDAFVDGTGSTICPGTDPDNGNAGVTANAGMGPGGSGGAPGAATYAQGDAGAQFQGGDGSGPVAQHGSGGGGGGYYGGGGGSAGANTCDHGGGGGSSYFGGLIGGSTIGGSNEQPANIADAHYQDGIGLGGQNTQNGGDGLIIIQWNDPSGPITEVAGDLIDNDCDGLVDCEDPDLATHPDCYICANSVGVDMATGDTTWQAVTPQGGYNRAIAIRHTGTTQSFTVPSGIDSVQMKIWGAGGAGMMQPSGSNVPGGAGGFTEGILSTTPGDFIELVVGESGKRMSNTSTFGGGGAGGTADQPFGGELLHGSSGGGRSAIIRNSIELATAGGGGGACGGCASPSGIIEGIGGAGGGTAGESVNGGGGTQVSGGSGGATCCGGLVDGEDGSQYTGGKGGDGSGTSAGAGGGGGGGYYGGGGGIGSHPVNGNDTDRGGGGGSAYIGGLNSGQTYPGSGALLHSVASTDVHYINGVGAGGGTRENGGDGLIIIQWNDPSGPITEIAGDFIDNDCDGLVDCADPDLALDPSCYSCNAVGVDSITGDTTWQVVTPGSGFNRAIAYRHTGFDQGFVIPAGVDTISVKAWGAGGGSDGDNNSAAFGGAGGFVSGNVPVTAGDVYSVMVGEGGSFAYSGVASDVIPGTYGFGGGITYNSGRTAGLGGGLSGLFSGAGTITAGESSRALLIAGGGGGADMLNTLDPNTLNHGGNGGSPQAGGQSDMRGISNVTGPAIDDKGAGGGGFFGGDLHSRGPGAGQAGEGGTNHIDATVNGGVTMFTTEFNRTAPNTGDMHHFGEIGYGDTGNQPKAGDGLVIIQWVDPSGPIAEIAGDFIDNDCDGLIDCADPDLATDTSCYACAAVGIDSATGDTTWFAVTPESGFTQAIAYRYTGSDQGITIPAGVTSINVKAWGAGGGSDADNGSAGFGGAGGFVSGDISVNPSDSYKLVVGEGGSLASNGVTATIDGVYGFGGSVSYTGGRGAGLGGGLSGFFTGSNMVFANEQNRALLIAGGGGGADMLNSFDANSLNHGGNGGSPQSGGESNMMGISTISGPGLDDKGSGGGGYFGGSLHSRGPGAGQAGEGGTNFLHASVSNGTNIFTTEFDRTAPNTGDVHYFGEIGYGDTGSQPKAGDGLIIVQFFNPTYVEICNNGIDDDCDGLIDEADPDCGIPNVVAVNDINVSLDGEQLMGNVLTNDFHTTGDTFAINISSTVNPNSGTLVLNNDGSYTYEPDSGFIGQDQFSYSICDTLTPQNCDTANVVIQVTDGDLVGTNDPPIANDDAYVGYENQPISGQVLNNDVDPENSPLTMSAVNISNIGGGSLTVNLNGTFTYTPLAGFVGSVSFTYAACDTNSPQACDTALVIIDVLPASGQNDPPFAGDDAAIGMDTISGDLLPNDSDPEGSSLVVNTTPIAGPNNGQVMIGSDGTYIYIPVDDFAGTDWFVYEICDTNSPAACAQATVYITVLPDEICANIWFYMEGPFADNGDSMTTLLNHFCDVLPNAHPYNVVPWNYSGNETVSSMPAGVVDWVLISFRNGVYLDSTKMMTAGLLYSDGQVRTVADENVVCYEYQDNDSMYVVVEHRNHMAAMTPLPILAPSIDPVVVDFRYSESFIVGSFGFTSAGQQVVGTQDVGGAPVYALFAGDPAKETAGKNDINSNDVPPLLSVIGQFGLYTVGDHNLDCDHNSNDLPYVLNNLAKTSVVE